MIKQHTKLLAWIAASTASSAMLLIVYAFVDGQVREHLGPFNDLPPGGHAPRVEQVRKVTLATIESASGSGPVAFQSLEKIGYTCEELPLDRREYLLEIEPRASDISSIFECKYKMDIFGSYIVATVYEDNYRSIIKYRFNKWTFLEI